MSIISRCISIQGHNGTRISSALLKFSSTNSECSSKNHRIVISEPANKKYTTDRDRYMSAGAAGAALSTAAVIVDGRRIYQVVARPVSSLTTVQQQQQIRQFGGLASTCNCKNISEINLIRPIRQFSAGTTKRKMVNIYFRVFRSQASSKRTQLKRKNIDFLILCAHI